MSKIVDSEQYRKDLLRRSFDLFAEKGYAAVTTRQLAQALEVSTGTLYHYFPSKAVLFQQLVEELMQQDFLTAAAELKEARNLTERLKALQRVLVEREDYFIKQMLIWIDFCQHQSRVELQNSEFFQRVYERYQQVIGNLLEITEPKVIWFVLCLVDGIFVERLCGNQKVSLEEQFELLSHMLISLLEGQ